MTALFGKNKNKKEKAKEELRDIEAGEITKEDVKGNTSGGSGAFSGVSGSQTHKILKGFYVSEKATLGTATNQYVFKIFNGANKSEVKKEVARLFNVKVKRVRMLNMPEKRRDFGKHPGTKTGFKKAIVVLEEGYAIGQAKP